MEISKTKIEGVVVLKPKIFSDNRGHFYEAINEMVLKDLGINFHVVQINQSVSKKGTLRGLHYQKEPNAQSKLVKVIRGRIIDFFLDLREDSPTYGQFGKVTLNQGEECVYIPAGLAHGFLALEDKTEIMYMCDDYYCPSSEAGYNFFGCPEVQMLQLDGSPYIQSEKDALLPAFRLSTENK